MNGIDYTNLGYEALREAMLALARERLPEWTDFSENDLGVLLVELFAYASDITLYYQSRIASNLFPETTDEPEALVQLLRLIGYELLPPAPATAYLSVAFRATDTPPARIPNRTQFSVTLSSGEQLTFETVRHIDVPAAQLTAPDANNLRYFFPVPVVEGATVENELAGTSDGSPNQMYNLQQQPVIAGSLDVRVSEPGGIVTRWQQVDTLADSTPADRHFAVQRNHAGAVTLIFGDGANGLIPPPSSAIFPVNIRVTYRVGGGSKGNVPASTEFKFLRYGVDPSLPPGVTLAPIIRAVNPQTAAGGAAGEDIDHARFFAPHLYRMQDRAVTAHDYANTARLFGGVGKARAVAVNWNEVLLYIAPAGKVAEPGELLKNDLLAFFENRRMASTQLTIVGPAPADIYLRVTVQAQPYYLQADVQAAVEEVVAAYLAFDAVDFGQPIYLSKLYDLIQSLPEVLSLLITEFSRTPYSNNVDSDGVIEIMPDELPRPGYRDNPATPPNPADPTRRPVIVALIQGGVAE